MKREDRELVNLALLRKERGKYKFLNPFLDLGSIPCPVRGARTVKPGLELKKLNVYASCSPEKSERDLDANSGCSEPLRQGCNSSLRPEVVERLG